jgi:hypothetical protein
MPPLIQIDDTVRRTVSPQAGNAPNMSASGDAFGAQIGRAVQGFGAEMRQAANYYMEEQRQRQDFETSTRFLENQSENATLLDTSSRAAEGTPAKDFTKTYMAEVRKRNQDFLSTIPEAERPRWQSKLAGAEAQLSQQALTSEFRTYDAFQTQKLSEAQDGFLKGIDQTPRALQTYVRNGEELIDQTNWGDGVKEEKKKAWRENATKAYAIARIRQDPESTAEALGAPRGPVASTVDKIINVESGGNPNAKNPKSSASGVGQFLDSTWLTTVRKYRPDLAGKNDSELLSMKSNPVLGREMTVRHMQENARALSAAGAPVTEGNLYLAHFAGSGGAVQLLRAPAGASVADVLGAGVIKANPFLEGKSAAWAVEWAAQKMGATKGSPPLNDPAYANLSYRDTLVLRDQATQEVASRAAAQDAQQQAAYGEWRNQFFTDIYDGKVGPDGIAAARQSGQLTDFEDITKANSLLGQREKGDADYNYFTAKAAANTAVWNPFDKADKDAVEAGVKQLGGTPQAAFDVWQKTGLLADTGAVALRGALVSTDPARVQGAATIAGNMLATNPNAFAGVTGKEDLEKAGTIFNHLVNQRGLTPDEASKRIAQENDPQYRAKIKVTDDAVVEFQKDLYKSDQSAAIMYAFDPGVFSSAPNMPVLPEQKQAILSDFVEAATDAYRMTGDADAAKAVATGEIKRQWGVSRGALVKFPPEQAYPSSGDPDDMHGYVYRQAALDVLTATGNTVAADDVFLVPLQGGQTAEAYRQGKAPPYQLVYRKIDPETGQEMFDVIPGKAFMADAKTAQTAASASRMQKLAEDNAVSAYKAYQDQKATQEVILEQQQRILDADRQNQLLSTGTYDPAKAPKMTEPAALPPEPPEPPTLANPAQAVDPATNTFSDPMTGFMQ